MQPKTKRALLQAAIRILSHNPEASLDDIAADAEVSRATAYRYFPSRKLLLAELTEAAVTACDEAVAPIMKRNIPAAEVLPEIIRALIPLGGDFHFLTRESGVCNNPETAKMLEKQQKAWEKTIHWLQQNGVINANIPTVWATAFIDSAIYSAWGLIQQGDLAPNAAPELVIQSVMNGIKG